MSNGGTSSASSTLDLLSLMTAADGNILPHSASCRDIDPIRGTAISTDAETQGLAAQLAVAERQRARRASRRREKSRSGSRRTTPEDPENRGATESVEANRKSATVGTELEFISVRQLARRWNVGVATVWRWAAIGQIPAPVHLGPGTTRWIQPEILAHEASIKARGPR